MPDPENLNLARLGYSAYGQATGGLNFQGQPMPGWDDLGERIQGACQAAAGAIVNALSDAAVLLSVEEPQPQLGRIVLVSIDPGLNNGATEAPAIITRVWSDTVVNLRVFPDGDGDTLLWTSAEYAESLDFDADEPNQFRRWTWPPRVWLPDA